MKILIALILTAITLLSGCSSVREAHERSNVCADAYQAQRRSLQQEREIAAAELQVLMGQDWYTHPEMARLPSASAAGARTSKIRNLTYRIASLNRQIQSLASSYARGSCDGINIYYGR